MTLPIYTHIPNLKVLTKIFFKLSRPKGNLCGGVTILNPKYPRLSSGDTINATHSGYSCIHVYLNVTIRKCFLLSKNEEFCSRELKIKKNLISANLTPTYLQTILNMCTKLDKKMSFSVIVYTRNIYGSGVTYLNPVYPPTFSWIYIITKAHLSKNNMSCCHVTSNKVKSHYIKQIFSNTQ